MFLSHLHSDHHADLASLYVNAMFGRKVPLEVCHIFSFHWASFHRLLLCLHVPYLNYQHLVPFSFYQKSSINVLQQKCAGLLSREPVSILMCICSADLGSFVRDARARPQRQHSWAAAGKAHPAVASVFPKEWPLPPSTVLYALMPAPSTGS